MVEVPVWICQLLQLPERGEEAWGVFGRVQPRRQARGRRSAMEARVRMEG
jgi:hypothetical protein